MNHQTRPVLFLVLPKMYEPGPIPRPVSSSIPKVSIHLELLDLP